MLSTSRGLPKQLGRLDKRNNVARFHVVIEIVIEFNQSPFQRVTIFAVLFKFSLTRPAAFNVDLEIPARHRLGLDLDVLRGLLSLG